jgi:hypothetical protein
VSFKLNGQKKGSDAGSTHSGRSRSKENRRSFFGGRLEGKAETGDGGDGDWVTDSGDTRDMGLRRSESQGSGYGRPLTATSVGSKVGNVRKRLSRLTLGRKNSRREFDAGGAIKEAD